MGRLRTIKDAQKIILNENCVIKDFLNNHQFKNQLINLEIGSGKGDFIIQKAINHSDQIYIAFEKYATVLLKAARKIKNIEHDFNNLFIINNDATNLCALFNKKSVNKIYLNFSDPWPKKRHENKRLTSKYFLKKYFYILKKRGVVEFKTDNVDLYQYTLRVLNHNRYFKIINFTDDLYHHQEMFKNNVQTEYEKKFVSMNKKICKIIFIKKTFWEFWK